MVIMMSSLVIIAYSEKLWCFSKCGKVSVAEFTRNNNQTGSTIATITTQRMVENIGSIRKKNGDNTWQFQN